MILRWVEELDHPQICLAVLKKVPNTKTIQDITKNFGGLGVLHPYWKRTVGTIIHFYQAMSESFEGNIFFRLQFIFATFWLCSSKNNNTSRPLPVIPNNLLGVGLKCCTIKRFDDVLAAGLSRRDRVITTYRWGNNWISHLASSLSNGW